MNVTLYPRHWLRFHLIANRSMLYVSLYLGWNWQQRRWHFERAIP